MSMFLIRLDDDDKKKIEICNEKLGYDITKFNIALAEKYFNKLGRYEDYTYFSDFSFYDFVEEFEYEFDCNSYILDDLCSLVLCEIDDETSTEEVETLLDDFYFDMMKRFFEEICSHKAIKIRMLKECGLCDNDIKYYLEKEGDYCFFYFKENDELEFIKGSDFCGSDEDELKELYSESGSEKSFDDWLVEFFFGDDGWYAMTSYGVIEFHC